MFSSNSHCCDGERHVTTVSCLSNDCSVAKQQFYCRSFIGVNICERKSGTERTKKRKKRELVFFPPSGGATGTLVHRLDSTRILPELR